MNRLRVGVVGVGALGRHHARIFSQLETTQLVGVADTSPERGRAAAEACRTRWLPDFHSLIGQVDAVSIAVPTGGHHAVASEFLQGGIAVMVEKPLASNLREASALVALAERKGATLQVGHVERFNPATQAAHELTGPPKYIRCERFGPFSFRSMDIGVVHDVMIHDIDLVLDFVGSTPIGVDAFGISILGEHDDCVQTRLTFSNGCVADLSANRVNPTSRRSMQVWSKLGCVTVDFSSREVVRYRLPPTSASVESLLEQARRPGADIESLKAGMFGAFIQVDRPDVPKTDALTAELASFADCVLRRSRPLVDGRAALSSMDVADRVLKAVADHSWNGRQPGPIGPFLREQGEQRRAA